MPTPTSNRTRKSTPLPEGTPEAPFYPDWPVLVVTQQQFDAAWLQMSATKRKPQSERSRAAAEAVMVKQLSYKRAAAALGEPQAYVRSAHLWNLERLRPFFGDMGLIPGVASQPLVLQGVPPELHAGIRERVERMVAQYQAAQPAPAVEDAAPAGTPPSET